METTTLTAEQKHEHTSENECPVCGALWVRMGNPRKKDCKRIYPEGGWSPLIRASIQEVFEIMLACPTGPGVHYPPDQTANMTAVVGLAGQLVGMMSVRCTSKAALNMAGAMLGVEEVAEDEVRDALGEVCNMVAGNFKAKISGLADGCSLSVPTVITGADYQLHPLADGERVIVSFSFKDEPVWIALDLHE